MKIKLIQMVLLIFAVTSGLIASELVLELGDVQNLMLENEKTAQPTVFVGAPFQLKVIVKNGEGGSLQILGLDKLIVQGESRMNNQRVINGAVSSERSIILNVVADKEGALTIGPVQAENNGAPIKSNTVQFRVIKQPQDSSKVKTASGKSLKDQLRDDQDVVCEFLSDKHSYFQGEPFIITLKVTKNEQIFGFRIKDKIKFPEFSAKNFGEQQNHQELRNNKIFDIIEQKFALVSLKPGDKVINSVTAVYLMNLFDQRQSQSNSLKLDIKPLPKTDEVVDGIGSFKAFTISVDKTSVLMNEAITLTLEICGSGNFDQIDTPKLALPDFIKNYESKNDFIPDDSLGAFGGKKKFEYVIQVSSAGEIKLPAQKFTYFDTNSKVYKTLKTEEIVLSIKQPVGEPVKQPIFPSDQQLGQQIDQQQSLEKKSPISKDIGFIEEDFKPSNSNNKQIPFWVYLILLLLPVLIVFGPYRKVIAVCRDTKAFKLFSKKAALSKFQSDFDLLKRSNKSEQIYGLFLNLLAAKFDITTQLITIDFIEQKLLDLGWDLKKTNEFTDYLNESASLHFITTKQKIDEVQSNNLFKKGQYWIMLLTNKDA
ncbi:MAG: BatD family protein [bacterium]